MAIEFKEKAQKIFLGDIEVIRVYKGNKQVYEKAGVIPGRYVKVSSASFGNGNYTGSQKYIILPVDKTSGYKIINSNVKGVATNGGYLTNASNMFNGHSGLSLELDWLDTSNVTNMSNMFASSQSTTLDLSNFDTSKVTNMASMFYNSQATTLDLSNFDTSSVIYMNDMFYNSQATTIDLSSFNTSNVTSMLYMFCDSQATTLDVSNFDTSKVTDMNSMFRNTKPTTLDVSNFDTSSVTNMNYMFESSSATTLDLSSFDTSNVTRMSYMFDGSQATTLDLSSFDTSNVNYMNGMFANSQATTLDLSSFDTSNVIEMINMFAGAQATTGYARTQADADRFNNTSNKPIGLTFVVKGEEPQGFTTTGFGSSNGVLENDSVLTRTTTSTSPTTYVWNSTLDDVYPFNVLGAKSAPLVENGNTMLWVPPYYWTPTLSPEGYLREITISEEPISSESILSKGVWIGAGQTNNSYKSATGFTTRGNTSITTFRSNSNWTNGSGKRYGAMNLYDWQSIKILMWVYFKSVRGSVFPHSAYNVSAAPITTFKTSGSDITSYVANHSSNYNRMSNYFFGFGNLLGGLEHMLDGVAFSGWNSNTMNMYATDDPSKYNNTGSGYNFIYRTPAPGYIKEVTVVNGLIVPAVTTGASRTTYYGSELVIPNTSISYTGLSTGWRYYITTGGQQDEGLNRMNGWLGFSDSHWSRGSRLRREE